MAQLGCMAVAAIVALVAAAAIVGWVQEYWIFTLLSAGTAWVLTVAAIASKRQFFDDELSTRSFRQYFAEVATAGPSRVARFLTSNKGLTRFLGAIALGLVWAGAVWGRPVLVVCLAVPIFLGLVGVALLPVALLGGEGSGEGTVWVRAHWRGSTFVRAHTRRK